MQKLGFLKPAFNFLWISLLISSVSRLILLLFFYGRVSQTPDFLLVFPLGLRTDLILNCYIILLPTLLLLFVPSKALFKLQRFFNSYFILFLSLIFFMELASLDFIKQYDTRPNRIFLDYLIYPKEVFGTLFKSYLPSLILSVLLMTAFVWTLVKFRQLLFGVREARYKYKLIWFPLVIFLIVFGARGSLTSKRPINGSNAVFSTDQLTNCLGLNSFYTVAFAAYSIKNEGHADKMYGKLEPADAIARVKKYMNVPGSDFTSDSIPTLHKQLAETQQPLNLVIILEESLGAEYVGCLGGLPLTPELDKLSNEGVLFTNIYATGTRSVRGIEAVVTGFLPSPAESVVKLSGSQTNFFTVAELLRQFGYDTSFIYGGMSNFDNMGSFFNGNGFDRIIDEDDFDAKKSAFHGTWGWSDEDVLLKANDYFKSVKGKPFVSLVFSSSNHEPFEFPDNRIKLYDQKKNTVNNAMKYADYSIGKFFEAAKKEAYYKNTVFLVIADHNTRTFGKNLVPIKKFHIPALLIGPGLEKGGKYNKLCSQIDILPTTLYKLGVNVETPMAGRNLFTLPETTPGRSIMQFNDINAFRVEDKVLIMQPFLKPQQFSLKSDTIMTLMPLDEEFAKDALGHVSAAGYLYKNNLYRLRNLRKK
ncbi:LTA synthase family protein [Flavobacterium silvaticum]|uniref:Sulfatase-like hydrolase/transferase n=1 Tax=Flavobacterium silvaticum TaxID=1852020 RepID=A0A972FMW1_9FLAO|nr:LTA synthase family protein [Flavobacterium silvaticum]NMH28966.1 sulfatase-like hydrolase/transferase [Flavobacterium silvaticum]